MLGQSDIWRRIALVWLSLGLLGLGLLLVAAIAVFGFGVQVYDRYSGQLLSQGGVSRIFLFMAPIFAIFAIAGRLGLLRLKSHK